MCDSASNSVPLLWIPLTISVVLLNNIAAYYMFKLLNIIVLFIFLIFALFIY